MTVEERKNDHLRLTSLSLPHNHSDPRFNYEPMLGNLKTYSYNFLNTNFSFPLWISSMTGGSENGKLINRNLAKAVNHFKLGMGLGSIRSYIDDETKFYDFNLRSVIGDRPLFANIGIAQMEQFSSNNYKNFLEKLKRLECDGLMIHINPLQESVQAEGDLITKNPVQTIEAFLDHYEGKVIIKEVGQGFGPRSLKALLELNISGIELASFGGTNFTKLEILRNNKNECLTPLINVGHDSKQMIKKLNLLYSDTNKNKEIIISGGLKNSLDGFYFRENLKFNSVFAFAGAILPYAKDEQKLFEFIEGQKKLFDTARNYLEINISEWECN